MRPILTILGLLLSLQANASRIVIVRDDLLVVEADQATFAKTYFAPLKTLVDQCLDWRDWSEPGMRGRDCRLDGGATLIWGESQHDRCQSISFITGKIAFSFDDAATCANRQVRISSMKNYSAYAQAGGSIAVNFDFTDTVFVRYLAAILHAEERDDSYSSFRYYWFGTPEKTLLTCAVPKAGGDSSCRAELD